MSDTREDQVRARAYGIWQEEGEPHGREQDHWIEAERQIAAAEPDAGADVTPDAMDAAGARRDAAKPGTAA